jgi:hypothetical protein
VPGALARCGGVRGSERARGAGIPCLRQARGEGARERWMRTLGPALISRDLSVVVGRAGQGVHVPPGEQGLRGGVGLRGHPPHRSVAESRCQPADHLRTDCTICGRPRHVVQARRTTTSSMWTRTAGPGRARTAVGASRFVRRPVARSYDRVDLMSWVLCVLQGGISNGETIIIRVAFKPTSTIGKEQNTVTRVGGPPALNPKLKASAHVGCWCAQEGLETTMRGKGRHDPCVLPRAVRRFCFGGVGQKMSSRLLTTTCPCRCPWWRR